MKFENRYIGVYNQVKLNKGPAWMTVGPLFMERRNMKKKWKAFTHNTGVWDYYIVLLLAVAVLYIWDKTKIDIFAYIFLILLLIFCSVIFHKDRKKSEALSYLDVNRGLRPKVRWLNQKTFLLNKKKLAICPKSRFKTELYYLVSNMDVNMTYKMVTHAAVIEQLKKNPRVGKDLEISVEPCGRKDVRKLIQKTANATCQKCPNLECATKKSMADKEKWMVDFYAVDIKNKCHEN